MRGIGNHTPPAKMQPEPEDNTSVHVFQQVYGWASYEAYPASAPLIHTESAREVAAWFQSFGIDGMPFAEFASSGTLSEELPAAIKREIAAWSRDYYLTSGEPLSDDDRAESAANRNALSALLAYVRACPVTVWRVSYVDACSIHPGPEVVARMIVNDSAVRYGIGNVLHDLFDDYAEGSWPSGCKCTDEPSATGYGPEACDRCTFEAHAAAWLADSTGRGHFSYAREDAATCPSWSVERVETTMGTEFGMGS